MTPTNQVKSYLLIGSQLGARLFRRNVGMGWIGQSTRFDKPGTVSVTTGDVLIRQARPFHNGEEGQADIYGWKPVTVTPDMVGTVMAQHVEIEAKQGAGRLSGPQKAWLGICWRTGVKAGMARSEADVKAILE